MAFDQRHSMIQPQHDIQGVQFSQVSGGSRLDKPGAGEKFKHFLKRGLGFLGKMAGVVSPFLGGGLGFLVGQSLYRLGGMANQSANNTLMRRNTEMQQESARLSAQGPAFAPGFNDPSISSGGPLHQERMNAVSMRSMAAGQAISQF